MLTNTHKPDAATQVEIFRRMALLKANDERARRAVTTGRLMMVYYSYRGQEVIPAALSVNLNDDDYLVTIYRGIHDMLAKGLPLKELWAEMAGRVDGTCKGKGGPMHLTYPKKGIMVTTGIVGSSMPIANGLGWAAQLDGSKRVAVATFGDAAANIGAFHESLNLASIWKLPVIFLCQNNRWGEHTAYEKSTPIERIADRAASYGMPGIHVDGNDPVAMYGAAREAVERARAGEGPTLIEAMTFRHPRTRFRRRRAAIFPRRTMEECHCGQGSISGAFAPSLIADRIATEEQIWRESRPDWEAAARRSGRISRSHHRLSRASKKLSLPMSMERRHER